MILRKEIKNHETTQSFDKQVFDWLTVFFYTAQTISFFYGLKAQTKETFF